MNTQEDILRLGRELEEASAVLEALGNSARGRIIATILAGRCGGSRIQEIVDGAALSRPAASRHLAILRDAGIVKVRKEGTKVYYYLDPDMERIEQLITLFADIKEIASQAPERSGDD